MIRDPFDIHRKNAFRASATQAVQHIRQTATQVGTNALEMSFNIPKNVPNFRDPYRDLEDRAWQAMRSGGRMTGLVDPEGLPMYKDKPFAYAPSQRKRAIYKRKRTWILAVLLYVLLHWLHWLPWQDKVASMNGSSAWPWLHMSAEKKEANWDERREQVVEAFQLSWDAYAKHGWGA